MINLLPPQYKEELKTEEKLKIVLILVILFFSFLVSLTLILFSIYIYIEGEIETQEIIITGQEKQFETSKNKKIEEEIKIINQTVSDINSFYQTQFNFTQTLEKISESLPLGTYLTNLSFNPVIKKENKFRVTVSGFSPLRENLFEFKKNLEKIPEFKELYFPPSNWIEPVNINFNICFETE